MSHHDGSDWKRCMTEPGESPAIYFIRKGYLNKLKQYLEQGGDVNVCTPTGKSALSIAVQTKNLEISRFLLSKGADVNAREDLFGLTPLMYACMHGFKDLVALLLEHNASTHYQAHDKGQGVIDGWRAIDFAFAEGHSDIVFLIRSHKHESAPMNFDI